MNIKQLTLFNLEAYQVNPVRYVIYDPKTHLYWSGSKWVVDPASAAKYHSIRAASLWIKRQKFSAYTRVPSLLSILELKE